MDQRFSYATEGDALVISQESGQKLCRSEAIEVCRDIAAIRGVPIGKVQLRIPYALLPDSERRWMQD